MSVGVPGGPLGFMRLIRVGILQIHCDDYEFALTLTNGQGSQYVQTPMLERLGACDRR